MAAATTSMVVVAFLIPLAIAVRTIAINQALTTADTEARSLAPVIATVHDPQVLVDLVRSAGASNIGPTTVFMPDGEVIGAPAVVNADVTRAMTGRSFTTWTSDGAEVLVPVLVPQSGTAVVEIAVPNSRLQRGVATAWEILGATGLGLILLAVLVADRIARGVVAPTRSLAAAAHRVARGDLDARVSPEGPAEVVEVGRAFNILVARIKELLTAEREAAADLSHRLRTPLTALRLDVDQLPAHVDATRLTADVHAVEQAVNDVIRGLRADSYEALRQTTDVAATVRERIAFWQTLAQDQRRTFDVNLEPGTWTVELGRDEVGAIVDVLVGNVFAHTAEGTTFAFTLNSSDPDHVRLLVEDAGPGFSSSSIGRGESGAGSTGLGLDIVRRAAEATGGRIAISERPGGGARVEVLLGAVNAEVAPV
jgi:signal transduction histidine kinase